jgi:two-component system LytT family response regulator
VAEWRAVVVEDERLAREELIALLANERSVEVVGSAGSVEEAKRQITHQQPDLLFLDIQLGRETAFEFLEQVDASFEIIFVTAYDRHALRAFEVSALDYLLKPIATERLQASLARLGERALPRKPVPGLELNDRLFIKSGARWSFLSIASIRWIASAGDFTELHTAEGQFLLSTSMREWEARLPVQHFLRIHRSTIVQLDCVESVEEYSPQTFHVFLKGSPKPLPMSRRQAMRLRH